MNSNNPPDPGGHVLIIKTSFRRAACFRNSFDYSYKNDWAILGPKGQVNTFILDFEKAFDTSPHQLLKSKQLAME